jgi:hypothetical protein
MGAAIEPSTEKIATRVAYGKSLVELAKLNFSLRNFLKDFLTWVSLKLIWLAPQLA